MSFFLRLLAFDLFHFFEQNEPPFVFPFHKGRSHLFSDNTNLYHMVLSVVAVTFLVAYFLFFSLSAQAYTPKSGIPPNLTYNCHDSLGDTRCYGVVDWNGNVNGAHTTMDVVQLHAGDGHMNNSLWVANSDKNVWAEGGYVVKTGRSYESWYWAYQDGSGQYYEYDSSGLDSRSGGDFGYPAEVTVWRVSGSTWNVAIYGHSSRWVPNGFTNTALSPYYIQMGEELEGTNGGGSDSHAHFKNNYWISTKDNSDPYQTSNGYKNEFGSPSNPPSSGWTSWATQPIHSSTGGDWNSGTS